MSNLRLLDCINDPIKLIKKAQELGLAGIAITDHEALCCHIKVNKYMAELEKENSNFTIALGNEIYLIDERHPKQPYYHFILIAKDAIGHRLLREQSSVAWYNSYSDRNQVRVPTEKRELVEIIGRAPGHVIATSACFLPGQSVETKFGKKFIEDIRAGDLVLNKNGEYEEVIVPTQIDYDGLGYEISFIEDLEKVKCTADHKFLVTTNNKIQLYKRYQTNPLDWVEAKDLNVYRGSGKHICLYPIIPIKYTFDSIILKTQWKHFLRKDDYLTKKPINNKIILTPEVMRLFGLWIGDGHISINHEQKYYRIGISFNIEEFDFYWSSFIEQASAEIGIDWSKTVREDSHKVELVSNSLELVELFYWLFGNVKGEQKDFPSRLVHVSEELDFNLIFGYLLADGYFRTREKDGYSYGEMVSNSISGKLINSLQSLLKAYGIRSSCTEKASYQNAAGNHQKSYILTSSNAAWMNISKKTIFTNDDIKEIFNKAILHNSKNYITINNVLYKKVYIKSKAPIQIKEKVYCLKNTSHSFVCGGVIVHNCIGGEMGKNILEKLDCERFNDYENAQKAEQRIKDFILYCLNLFGEDFYLEAAPACSKEQIAVNKEILNYAKQYNIKMCIGSDSHYLREEDRFAHKAYLTSKEGDREVDTFYEYAHLMTPDEARENLRLSFDDDIIDWIFNNSLEIKDKISYYSLLKPQQIPEVKVKYYPKGNPYAGINNSLADDFKEGNYQILNSLFYSDNIQERYWVNQCFEALIEKKIGLDDKYLARLEEEARVKRVIGEKLGTCMFAYPNTLQHYIDLFWKCGSTVGAGRGSACSGLNHYLLGITQLDPIQWDLPFWRYMNDDRTEIGDIDLDLCPSKLQRIFRAIREERGELGLVQVCTFGTEKTKNAILVACRGYRSQEYPNGIDSDEALYLSSLIPQERGFVWNIHDVIYGNEEKGRKPQTQFISAAKQYPGLLDIIESIEGLVSRRGIHASGVILFNADTIYDDAAIMRAPNGALTTQWDLHDQEAAGGVKYDFLLTDVQDIIVQTVEFLQRDSLMDPNLTLREAYNKYLHPSVLPLNDERIWNALAENKVVSCFQFDSAVGASAARKIKPHNVLEMADANGLMRLMPESTGAESPLDKYVRFKNNIELWYEEMRQAGLSREEQKILEPYFLKSYGVPPSQEQLMQMLMDKNICGFTLAEANGARKIVGKKQMDKIPALHQKVIDTARSETLGKYVWEHGVGPQLGYSFSVIHALAYTFIGVQTLYLATSFNPIYWDTACLIINSSSIQQEEDDDKSNGSVNYDKIARAIGDIQAAGIKVGLIDINKSNFGFEPDIENNQILFGLKGLLNVGDDIVETIIKNRPYANPKDFIYKVKPNKSAMISLIKSGAFDNMVDRKFMLAWYLWETGDKKKRINLQNMNGLITHKLLPTSEEFKEPYSVYEFNRYLKAKCKDKKDTVNFYLDNRAIEFLNKIDKSDLVEQLYSEDNFIHCSSNNLYFIMNMKKWDKVYQRYMDIYRKWMTDNQEEILFNLNKEIFLADWKKYAACSSNNLLSAWEMEVMCFYYHEHELQNLNNKYGYVDFSSLPPEPKVEKVFYKKDVKIPIYKLSRIYGTCIAKNKTKSTVSLLTPSGVVTVKFRKEYFSLFDKRISLVGADGVKHVVEKSWFDRGSMIVVTGMRRDKDFIAKKYASIGGHQLYKITKVNADGTIELQEKRAQGEEEDG